MPRTIKARYVDPLDQIWQHAAARLGLRLRRGPSAYASTDGRGTLTIAPPEDLDADDCLAQIILHELCHALVQGEDSFVRPDWGLGNDEAAQDYQGDTAREHACLRTQAALLRRHGLQNLLAPTTDFREYYDRLPRDPLCGDPGDPSVPLAREALGRAARAPFEAVLHQALTATAALHRLLQGLGPLPEGPLPSLWQAAPAPGLHRTGWPLAERLGETVTCGSCAWRFEQGGRSRCRRPGPGGEQHQAVDPAWQACVLHEGPISCCSCAACCRHAYDLVPLHRGEARALSRRHPGLVAGDRLRRDAQGRRCAALSGPEEGPYACTIYAERPSACSGLPVGGAACLQARRRVGLSI